MARPSFCVRVRLKQFLTLRTRSRQAEQLAALMSTPHSMWGAAALPALLCMPQHRLVQPSMRTCVLHMSEPHHLQAAAHESAIAEAQASMGETQASLQSQSGAVHVAEQARKAADKRAVSISSGHATSVACDGNER